MTLFDTADNQQEATKGHNKGRMPPFDTADTIKDDTI